MNWPGMVSSDPQDPQLRMHSSIPHGVRVDTFSGFHEMELAASSGRQRTRVAVLAQYVAGDRKPNAIEAAGWSRSCRRDPFLGRYVRRQPSGGQPSGVISGALLNPSLSSSEQSSVRLPPALLRRQLVILPCASPFGHGDHAVRPRPRSRVIRRPTTWTACRSPAPGPLRPATRREFPHSNARCA